MSPTLPTSNALDLSAILVRLSRECGVGVEQLRADQLLKESQSAWPGDEEKQWSKWLREACECLALRSQVVNLTIEDALNLSQDGALIVGGYHPDHAGLHVLLGWDGRKTELATGELDGRRRISRSELTKNILHATDSQQIYEWVVVEHPELSDADDARHLHNRPFKRLLRIVRPEWPDIWMILVFAFFAGVLNLATPIAVEALVNTVSFGQQLQPVLVLATLLFGFLAFAALMKGMQTYVAEIIQRRLFARVAADLAYRLPRVESNGLHGEYGPELVNRFLDVVTLQKVVAQLLLDGVSIVLATLVGMTVLAFYHPWLLGFDVFLLIMIVAGIVVLGRGGISSCIDESKMKYRLTAWFEDLMRCQNGFKVNGGAEFAIDRANQLTAKYLSARRSHFTILFRQISFTLALQAVAGTVLLGAGGWLVIQGQLSLGQLVAAELIVTTILSSLAKLGKHLEGFYDVIAAVDKLGHLFDLPVERHDGMLGGIEGDGVDVSLVDLESQGKGWLSKAKLSAEINAGDQLSIYGPSASGKTMLARLFYGLDQPKSGRVEIGGSDPRDLRPDVLRSCVTLIDEPELFEETISENIRLGRKEISSNDIRLAIDQVGLLDELLKLPNGIETKINASAAPLTSTQQRLLMIARAIVGKPRLLVIDCLLDSLPDNDLDRVVELITSEEFTWTLIVTTGQRSLADKFDNTIVFDDSDNSGNSPAKISGPPSEPPNKLGATKPGSNKPDSKDLDSKEQGGAK